jgi:hypothetical protein
VRSDDGRDLVDVRLTPTAQRPRPRRDGRAESDEIASTRTDTDGDIVSRPLPSGPGRHGWATDVPFGIFVAAGQAVIRYRRSGVSPDRPAGLLRVPIAESVLVEAVRVRGFSVLAPPR